MAKTTNDPEVGVLSGFTLPQKTVMIVPVRRKGGWLPDGHAAAFLHNQAYWEYPVARDQRTGQLKDPLTKEEREYFESSLSGMALKPDDMSIYKKVDNYWENFKVKLRDEVRVLNLANPKEYLMYKVLLTNENTIAKCAEDKFKKGTYKWAIVEEGYQNEERVQSASNKKDAYKFFGKIDTSVTKMKEFLDLYYTLKPGGKTVPPNATQEFLIAEIEKIIEGDLTAFLNIAKDKDYDKKTLLVSALKARAVTRKGMNFTTTEGTVMGANMQEAIAFMDNPSHSDEVIKIKARIDNAR